MSDERRLRVGVIGGGLISQTVHLPMLRSLDDRFDLVALADPSLPVRERLAARYGIPHSYEDHRALLDEGVDAVIACAPSALHAAMVLDALDAGAHVLVEKPMCLTVDEADLIVERALATQLVVQVGYMKRFAPAYESLVCDLAVVAPRVRLVSTLTVDPRLARDFEPPGFVRADAGSEGPDAFTEAFMGALIHDVNLVHGVLQAPAGDVVDAFFEPEGCVAGGTVELADGGRWTMAWLLLEGAGTFSEDLRFLADEGEWRLQFPAPYARHAPAVYSCERRTEDGWRRDSEASYVDAYTRELEHFHACITSGERCRTPPEQARKDIALLTRLCGAALGARA